MSDGLSVSLTADSDLDPDVNPAEVIPLPVRSEAPKAIPPLAVQSAMDFEAEMDALFGDVPIEAETGSEARLNQPDHPPEPAFARPVEETVADVEGFFF